MTHYFTVDVVTPEDVIFAYRGDDDSNSLEHPIPPDGEAQQSFQLPKGLLGKSVEAYLGQMFKDIALTNPTNRILVRLENQALVTYWFLARRG